VDFLLAMVGSAARTIRPRGRHIIARFLNRRSGSFEYRDRWGYSHTADLSDPSESLAFVGKPALPRELHGLLGPGDWVIDAGANVGVLTAELRHIVGSEGEVWAFEPLPRNVRRLENLRDVNGLPNIRIFPGALSSTNGVASLGLPADGDSAHPSLSKTTGLTGRLEVQTWALDTIALPASGKRLRFIKIDVEGHEPDMLRGATGLLESMRPVVLCEFNDALLREGSSSAVELLAMFEAMGYRATKAYREGRPLAAIPPHGSPWEKVPVDWMVVDLLLEPAETTG
jgi:FkbM family methyltransferase